MKFSEALAGACTALALCVLAAALLAGGCVCSYATRVADVAGREADPATLLKRYEWFKDAAAAIDAKDASLRVYQGRIDRLKQDYAGRPRADWPRDDREQLALWEQEVAGLKASRNRLAAEYNAAMSKENYRFCEAGRLPQGASKPLPREYKPYLED